MWDHTPDGNDRGWFFDPERHSAAELVGQLADHCRDHAGDHPTWSRWEGAFSWLRDTLGLDLAEIERRWQTIRPIPVPPPVSEGHGIDDTESLFGYLNQVRLAHIIGADLVAIALCRTTTRYAMATRFRP
jgi:hypothetical protein